MHVQGRWAFHLHIAAVFARKFVEAPRIHLEGPNYIIFFGVIFLSFEWPEGKLGSVHFLVEYLELSVDLLRASFQLLEIVDRIGGSRGFAVLLEICIVRKV